MKKIVSFDDYRIEIANLRKELYELSEGSIEVYSMQTWGDSNAPIELGINWYACGTQSLEKTSAFAEALQTAVEMVRNFKYNGYMIDWKD